MKIEQVVNWWCTTAKKNLKLGTLYYISLARKNDPKLRLVMEDDAIAKNVGELFSKAFMPKTSLSNVLQQKLLLKK